MKQILFFLILFLALNCFGQSDPQYLAVFKNGLIVKESYDTIYRNTGIHCRGKFIRKQVDEHYDIYLNAGWCIFYYSHNKFKDSVLFNNYGVPIIQKLYFRNGNFKLLNLADTTSDIKPIVFGKYFKPFGHIIYYVKKYRKIGGIKKEGNFRENTKIGEWIFYDRKGVIRKRKNYDK